MFYLATRRTSPGCTPPSWAQVDGEIVALDEKGLPSFQALQHSSRQARIVFYAFDVLHLDGVDLTARVLDQRRASLRDVVADSGVLVSQELPGTAAQVIGRCEVSDSKE